MRMLDGHRGGLRARLRLDAYVKVVFSLYQMRLAIALPHQASRRFDILGADGSQDLKTQRGVPAYAPERGRHLDAALAAGIGHGDALDVFDDVAAAKRRDVFGKRSQDRARLCRGIGDGNRLRTAQGRDQFVFENGNVVVKNCGVHFAFPPTGSIVKVLMSLSSKRSASSRSRLARLSTICAWSTEGLASVPSSHLRQ